MTNPYAPLEEDALVNFAYFERLIKMGEEYRHISGIALAQHEERPELMVLVEFSVGMSILCAFVGKWPSTTLQKIKEVAKEHAPEGVEVKVQKFYRCWCIVSQGGSDD